MRRAVIATATIAAACIASPALTAEPPVGLPQAPPFEACFGLAKAADLVVEQPGAVPHAADCFRSSAPQVQVDALA